MKRVYTASGLVEAYLVRDFLDAQGVRALVFNEHSVGAVGELPCNEVLPQIWIRDDRNFDRARFLLERYEQTECSEEERSCPDCAENNPASFDICWRCGHALDGDVA